MNFFNLSIPGSTIEIDINQGVDTIQWMSNDLRDTWSNIHSYDHGDKVILEYEEIVHELEHLPGITLLTNHTLSVRGLEGTTSSPLVSIDILLTDEVLVETDPVEASLDFVVYGSVFAAIILSIVLLIAFMKNESSKEAIHDRDVDIEEVVEAEIID